MLIKSADNKLDIFECIYFGKNADDSKFTLHLRIDRHFKIKLIILRKLKLSCTHLKIT